MNLKSSLQILLLSAVWGVSFLMIRVAGTAIPPLWIALLRCALGAVLLAVVMFMKGNKLPPRQLLPWLVLVAFFNNVIPFVCFAWGELTVSSNVAAVINATTPIWTLLFALGIERSRPTLSTTCGVLLAFAGVIIVVATRHDDSTGAGAKSAWFGVALIACAALSYAIATTMAKLKLKGVDPYGLATSQLVLASLMLTPAALLGPWPSTASPGVWGAIAVLGFAGSGVAYMLYYNLLARVSATQVVAVTYLLPVWGLFWGLFAGEHIGLGACIGVAITIVGLVMLNFKFKNSAVAVPNTRPR